ncbi:MAG: Rad52/Rad22 family DNA repair protein, partial [Hyphomicrobium sp.]
LREGIGTGFGRAREPELAHEIALKAAETDATKRALATFGNAFGLALYDRDRSQVTKAKGRRQREYQGPPVSLKLARKDGTQAAFIDVDAFVAAAIAEIAMFTEVDNLYAYWSANLASFAELRLRSDDADPAGSVIAAIQERLRQLVIVQPMTEAPAHCSEPKETFDSRASYGFPKEKRVRDKAHLAFVARQPCLVCGRRPAQAHHLRFAQPRAMALKVSDEFTLPLCNTHHDALHRTGDERAWWARHGFVEPLKIAGRLWAASHDPSQKAEDWYGQGPMEVVEDSKTVSKSSSPTGKDETRDPAD